jgi:tripartite-type tricarboxylate transporter receptor subunit TctC
MCRTLCVRTRLGVCFGARDVAQGILVAAAFEWLVGCTSPSFAQDWPRRSIRIIVAFGPGGGADIISRILGQALQERFGQPVIIENRPGAGGTIGNEAEARADKDGYTLGIIPMHLVQATA